jgi:hypothetical protein
VTRLWTLDDLARNYPDLADGRATLACVERVAGRGRHLKRSPDGLRSQFADVALHTEPAASFEVRFDHSWPPDVSSNEATDLDQALLRGIVESLLRPPARLDQCMIVTDMVSYASSETNPLAVSIAASLALVDVLKKGGWYGDDSPPPAVARRA